MNSTTMTRTLRAAAASLLLLAGTAAHAGGPLAICESGQPFLWPGGGANVPFNPDQGALGVLGNAAATTAVTDAFQAWADVPSATISYTNAGTLPVDVDITNFLEYLQPDAPDGLSAIVFDDTGEIFEAIYGPDSGILGFAGPEWIDSGNCSILEGVSFLNGPAIDTLEGLLDLMVHEFGHYSNLAHTTVNGQLFIGLGDSSGPGSDNTFGNPPFPDPADIIETMYPFLFTGIDQRSRTPHADDVAILSRLYPQPDFAANTGSISGTISYGSELLTGVNVIARNVNDPFIDAVSAISSDFTDDFAQDSELTGLYTITGLTPGEEYAVYVDEILDGGFSTPLESPLPGPEEFYNGANESGDFATDIPNEFVPVAAAAGAPAEGIDIQFNVPAPLSPLPTGDDGSVEIPLPFEFCVAGKPYTSAFINGNGFLTLGAPAEGFTFDETVATFLSGPPRIAAFWDDLDPTSGGSVFYEQTDHTFSVTWDAVPEFLIGGANTVTVTLADNSLECVPPDWWGHGGNHASQWGGDGANEWGYWDDHHNFRGGLFGDDVKLEYGELSALDGIAGVSAGAFATSGFETGVDLEDGDEGHGHWGWWHNRSFSLKHDAAVFEVFTEGVDLANNKVRFDRVGRKYRDDFERNDSLLHAARIRLPFDSIDTKRDYTSIAPAAADIDFFRFKHRLEGGTTLVAEVLTSQVDTVMGLYRCDGGWGGWHSQRCYPSNAELVTSDDDGGNGLLSRIVYTIPEDGRYALAVTFCCDYDFDGVDPGQGGALDEGRYVLDAYIIDGEVLQLTDESTTEVELDFEFPYQGETYSSLFVNANGYLTFGAGETQTFTPNVPDFEGGLPRVAPLWVDLDPGSGGLIYTEGDSGGMTITFAGVPEFFFGGSNNFSVTLDAGGGISMSYVGMTAPDGITGLAEGGGAVSTPVDLSTSPTWSASGSTHEQFDFLDSPFDLDGTTLTFEP